MRPRDVVYEQRMMTVRVVAAVVEREGRYLVTQRRSSAVLPDLWEFPGGKVEPAETDEVALAREFRERLGAEVEVGEVISTVEHAYERYTVDLRLYDCKLVGDELHASAVAQYRWLSSAEFDEYEFTPADEASMNQLLGEA